MVTEPAELSIRLSTTSGARLSPDTSFVTYTDVWLGPEYQSPKKQKQEWALGKRQNLRRFLN